ncbi:major facilitator superfamily domain-containing protein [Aspergillus recurvatus]
MYGVDYVVDTKPYMSWSYGAVECLRSLRAASIKRVRPLKISGMISQTHVHTLSMPSPMKDNLREHSTLPSWEADPANPQTWSMPKKLYNTAVPSFLCLLISFALAIYSPSHTHVQHTFQTNTTTSLLPFTTYIYGLAFGPMVAAPLSETYGRRLIYLLMTPLSLLFILGAGFSTNITTLSICRLFAGLFISAPLAVGAGTVVDLWSGPAASRAVVILMTMAFLGPAIGSLVGGWVAEYQDWRWTQWMTLFLGAGLWVFSFGAEETYAKPILRRRAARSGLGLPVPSPSSDIRPIPKGMAGVRAMVTVTLTRPLSMLLTEPIVLLCSLYSSLNFAVLFCFLACVPLIYTTVYDFSLGHCGLIFIALALGCILGAIGLIALDHCAAARPLCSRQHPDTDEPTPSPPELTLWPAMLGGPLMAGSLFMFAWTTASVSTHWMCGIIAVGVFGCANIMVFVSTALYLTKVYGAGYGASALAANGLLRYLVGGSFPLFTIAMYNNLGFPWASSLLGFVAAGFAPLPWVFYYLGARVRGRSAYT